MTTPIAHSKLAMFAAIAAIVLLLIFNLGFWVVAPSMDSAVVVEDMRPLPGADSTNSFGSLPTVSNPSTPGITVSQLWLVASGVVALVLLGVGGWQLALILQRKERAQRNSRRQSQLTLLQQGLETYKSSVGRYPVGVYTTQRAVPAAALGYDWESLGFPAGTEMKKYIADWPIVDPLVSYEQHEQRNQYLYYPLDGGEAYALYAHLEAVDTQAGQDFNQTDGLPRAWGDYNYKVTGPAGAAIAPPPVPASPPPAVPPAPKVEVLPPPIPEAAPVPTVVPPVASPPVPVVEPTALPEPLSEADLYRLGQSEPDNRPQPPVVPKAS